MTYLTFLSPSLSLKTSTLFYHYDCNNTPFIVGFQLHGMEWDLGHRALDASI
jgi:hypothetical protein